MHFDDTVKNLNFLKTMYSREEKKMMKNNTFKKSLNQFKELQQ